MNQDLRQRIPVAIVYVLGILGCLYHGVFSATVMFVLFYMMCHQEFATSAGKKKLEIASIAVAFFTTALMISPLLGNQLLPHASIKWIALISTLLMLFNTIQLFRINKIIYTDFSSAVGSLLYLSPSFILAALSLHYYSEINYIFVGMFILIWLSDTGAYFVGRAIGRHKLAPRISPSKTWEGFVGGVLLALVVTSVLAAYIPVLTFAQWIILALIVCLAGVVGDLTESRWKRSLGIKDSGTLLRGHGGFLDRLDSFIYAIPIVILYFALNYSI